MQYIVDRADENGIEMELMPKPFGDKKTTKKALVDFYKKFGFKTKENGYIMVRPPKGQQPDPPKKRARKSKAVDALAIPVAAKLAKNVHEQALESVPLKHNTEKTVMEGDEDDET